MKRYSDPSLEEKAAQEARRLIAGVLLDEVERHGEYTTHSALCDLVNSKNDYKTRLSGRLAPKDAAFFLEELLVQSIIEVARNYPATKDPPSQSYKTQLTRLDDLKRIARTGISTGRVSTQNSRQDAGRRVAQQQGKVIWSDREKEYALILSNRPEYQSHYGGQRCGQVNNLAIARELNKRFHGGNTVRTRKTVSAYISKLQTAIKPYSSGTGQ